MYIRLFFVGQLVLELCSTGWSQSLLNEKELIKKDTEIIEVLAQLEKKFEVTFAYQKKFLEGKQVNSTNTSPTNLDEYLKELLAPHRLTFNKIENIRERIYVISPLREEAKFSSSKDSTLLVSPGKLWIYGTVQSANQHIPIEGVNVILKGVKQGTMTDRFGNFLLEIPDTGNQSIQLSCVGYESIEVPVSKDNPMQISLSEKAFTLSEVVVTALGIDREEKALGYSVNTIGSAQVTTSGNTNMGSALYGKAPGVRIRSAPGGATSAVTIQVRGLNSLNYNAQPLYVIDGVIMRDGNERGAGGINNDDYYTDPRIRGNGILDINPADIDNISILKGASATTLYGSEASSGVVIITTKKGLKKSGMGVEVNYQVSQEEAAFTPVYQNVYGPGFDRNRNLAMGATADGWVPIDTNGDGIPDTNRPLFESYSQFGPKMEGQEVMWWDGTKRKYSPQPNNFKDLYRKGLSSAMNVALSNQVDRWSYRLSFSRNDYEGIQVGGKMARNTVNLNTSLAASNRLKVDLMLNYTNSFVHNRPVKINRILSSWNGFFSRAEDMSLFFNKYKTSDDFKWVSYEQSYLNPAEALKYATPRGYEVMNLLWQQLMNSEDETQNRLLSSLTLSYHVAEKIKIRSHLGYDVTGLSTESRQRNEYPVRFNSVSSTGSFGVSSGSYKVVYGDALITYSEQLSRNLKLITNVGFQLRDERYTTESLSTSGGLVLENWFSLNNSYNPVLTTARSTARILKYAYLGIANLSYKDFLFLEATARQEYSSTLPPHYNSYFYPSLNSSFVFSDVIKMPAFVDFAKLRASFGVVGNSPPPYESNIVYNLSNLQTSSGSVISATTNGSLYGNNSIRPERKYELELGLNVRLFHQRLGFDLTYYQNRIVDQILKLDVPSSSGAASILANSGTLGGYGLELGLSGTPVSRKIIWNSGLNVAFNTTKLLDLSPGVNQLVLREMEGSSIRVVATKGQTVGDIYVYPRRTDANGNLIISDNGLFEIDHTQYVKVGNLLPQYVGGFMNTLIYKNFNFQFNFDFSFGGQLISPALKYGLGSGMYESTLRFRDAEHGGLPYYINASGTKTLLPSHSSPSPNGPVYHDGLILTGVNESGVQNHTIVDAASYYLNTFDWGNNAWNEAGAVYDNSYVKMRELALGYSLPKKIANHLHFQSVRISLIGRNLFYVWRTLKNLDPESTIGTNWLNQGIDESAGTATRSYGMALSLSF